MTPRRGLHRPLTGLGGSRHSHRGSARSAWADDVRRAPTPAGRRRSPLPPWGARKADGGQVHRYKRWPTPATRRPPLGRLKLPPTPPPFSMLPGRLRRVVDDVRHVAILRRLAELSPIGLPVQLRALADGFEYERANRPAVLPVGGRIPEWFVSAVDQLVAAKLV